MFSRLPLLSIMALIILTGCSRVSFDADPLSWITSPLGSGGVGDKQNQDIEEPDMLTNVTPFEPKPSGTLGSLGLNLDMYFADKTSNDERFKRLERAVLAMHRDMKAIAPAMQKLVELQHEKPQQMQQPVSLSPHSQTLSYHQNADGVSQNLTGRDIAIPSPEHESTLQPGPRDMSPIPPGTVLVSGLRVGEHADKIRLVFDVTGKTAYTVDLDNEEKLLIVEFPSARWNGPDHEAFPRKNYLLSSYRAGTGSSGNMVVVQLKKSSKILSQTMIPALSGDGKRIVIDLKK